jgi:hypothetical protein
MIRLASRELADEYHTGDGRWNHADSAQGGDSSRIRKINNNNNGNMHRYASRMPVVQVFSGSALNANANDFRCLLETHIGIFASN